ncbi:Uncharacterised protein [uncultured archaeon]|nr:Uncharacterised protein [uncultured archaeon]
MPIDMKIMHPTISLTVRSFSWKNLKDNTNIMLNNSEVKKAVIMDGIKAIAVALS